MPFPDDKVNQHFTSKGRPVRKLRKRLTRYDLRKLTGDERKAVLGMPKNPKRAK